MGAIGKLISTKMENYVSGIIQKKLGENKEGAFYSPAGDDSPPLPGDKIFMSSIDGAGKVAFLGSLMITRGAEPGEKILYSRDSSGVVKGKLLIDKTGKFILNDGTKLAARKEDPTIINVVTDSAFIGWIANVSSLLNGIAPGSVPVIPTTATGKINGGTSEVLLP